MAEPKSKLPDMNEVTEMVTKLCRDVKTSVLEIVDTYKEKREAANDDSAEPQKEEAKKTENKKTEEETKE